jgi:beta-lactamase class A
VNDRLQALVDDVVEGRPGVRWSICLRAGDGTVLASAAPSDVLPTASIGKLLLLLELARRLEADPALASRMLDRRDVERVGEAGLWQHLQTDVLPVSDVAVLVASCSDNLATNVLACLVGLDEAAGLGRSLGFEAIRLLDVVRQVRDPEVHPPHLSEGSAGELSDLMARLADRSLVSGAVSEQLEAWLATDADLSMVAAAFGLDPLAHVEPDLGLLLRHKTGTDAGTKGDVGLLRGDSVVAYAAIARWEPERVDLRLAVDRDMRRIGEGLLAHVR